MIKKSGYSIEELAHLIHAGIVGSVDPKIQITGIAPIAEAVEGELTYVANNAYSKFIEQTRASVIILSKNFVSKCKSVALVTAQPEAAYAEIAKLFEKRNYPSAGIHPRATIGQDCQIDPSAHVGPNCVIGDRVHIGAHTIIMAGTVIGEDSHIQAHCILYANVTLYDHVTLGNRVTIHSGTVIGADGFGYARTPQGWNKVPQLGGVEIEDDVEIGSNTSIDRGAIRNTILRRGVKIDNLVQIGHNVEIGENSIIAGCTGIAGSAKIGRNCLIGGGCRLNGHVSIADGVMLAGATVTLDTIDEPGIYSSAINATPHRQWMRTLARLHNIEDLAKKVKQFERKQDESNG